LKTLYSLEQFLEQLLTQFERQAFPEQFEPQVLVHTEEPHVEVHAVPQPVLQS
jgi:hypothetical protein